jgi:hypothetical protein
MGDSAEAQSVTEDGIEICLNLWYVCDEDGLVYSLRARAYVLTGPEHEKLAELQRNASRDYLIATPYPVPDRWHTEVDGERMAIVPLRALELYGGPRVLFDEVYRKVEDALPFQTPFGVPDHPLVCTTALVGHEGGELKIGMESVGRGKR